MQSKLNPKQVEGKKQYLRAEKKLKLTKLQRKKTMKPKARFQGKKINKLDKPSALIIYSSKKYENILISQSVRLTCNFYFSWIQGTK